MYQEHPDIRVTTLWDASEPSLQAAGVFPGCPAEIAGEVALSCKASDITDECYKCSGTEQPYAGDSTQATDYRIIIRQDPEVSFDITDTDLEILDLYACLV